MGNRRLQFCVVLCLAHLVANDLTESLLELLGVRISLVFDQGDLADPGSLTELT
ncbi:hypothetical protein ACDY97_29560 [Rhizobium mongolense]|uniref:hypothetical protein n=1 Tax=Rhizobium mongolense TaxID=57676 RepID=UPI0035561FB5